MAKKTKRNDDFSKVVIDSLAKQVAYVCSNPTCAVQTLGPSAKKTAFSSLGVAAHICAASPGGPRYDALQTPEERSSANNGIWLCNNCSRIVDNDPMSYPKELLHQWKTAAVSVAVTQMGRKVLKDADAQDRMKAAFRALPTQQSQFAISNVHRATQEYFEEKDKRLKVTTSFNGNATAYQIRAKEDVPLQMTWTAHDNEQAMRDFMNVVEQGESATLEMASMSVTGSPVFEELLSGRGPGKLRISAIGKPVTVKLFAQDQVLGYQELAIGDGEVTHGTKKATLVASFFQGQVSIRISSPIDISQTSEFKFSINFERWNEADLRKLREVDSVAKLLKSAEHHKGFYLECFIDGTVIQEFIPFDGKEDFLRMNSSWFNFIMMARKIAHAFSLSIPFNSRSTITREDYLLLADAVETLEGRRTKDGLIADSIELTANINESRVFPEKKLSLQTDFSIPKQQTLRILGHEVTLPPVVVHVEGDGTLARSGEYNAGDVAQITLLMQDVRALGFYFNMTPGLASVRVIDASQTTFPQSSLEANLPSRSSKEKTEPS